MRLLVVEDDPDLNRQLTTALSDAGYVVTAHSTARRAIFSAIPNPTMR